MGKFYESKLYRAAQTAYELIKLNIVAVLCSLPIITIGAVWTGLYASVGNLYTNTGSTISDFFAGFRKNFKRATLHWLLLLVFAAFAVGDILILYYYSAEQISKAAVIIPLVICLIAALCAGLLFPMLNIFRASFFHTIRISFVFSVKYFLRAVFVFILNAIPFILLYVETSLFLSVLPIWLLIAFALLAYAGNWTLQPVFEEVNRLLEEQEDNPSSNQT